MRRNKWNVDFVGVLAEESEVNERDGRNSIFINNTNSIQFYIKIISEKPYSFPQDIPWVSCFVDELQRWGFEDDSYASELERKERLRAFLDDNLIIFHPEERTTNDFKKYYVATNIQLIPKNPSFYNTLKIVPIPIFSEQLLKITLDVFLGKLSNGKYIGKNDQISNEEYDTPAFIFWRDSNQKLTIYGEFENHSYAHGGFRFIPISDIHYLDMKNEWEEEIYLYQNVGFVPKEIYEEIVSAFKKPDHTIEKIELNTDNNYSNNEHSTTIKEDQETQFMNDFIETTKKEGLFYDEKDLYNFHTAVKTGNLVILSGMSGTGKSKLVQAYAKTLGLGKDQFSFIPVRPSWTDDSDLIGYADTLNMVFRPGDSGLINTLLKAEKEQEKLFLICFDEMNLARVEHYFSQFLSVLEMDEGKRILQLYNDDLTNRFYNSAQYQSHITIGDNVMFIGTVNIDESTYHFSDKVLDRANLISLSILPYDFLFKIEDKKKNIQKDPISKETYDSFKNHQRKLSLFYKEVEFLWSLHEELQITKKELGIGPRIIRQIDRYIKNLPQSNVLKRKEAFDLQIVQRIMTKVRGPEDLLSNLIGEFNPKNNEVKGSKIMDILTDYKEVSDFIHTKNIIKEKAKELKLNGYTI